MMLASLPPGLGQLPATTPSTATPMPASRTASETSNCDEAEMLKCLRSRDNTGVVSVATRTTDLNVRMATMYLNALVDSGTHVETAAAQVLQACAKHGLPPSAAIYNSVLH